MTAKQYWQLCHEITEYDSRAAMRAGYNRYALPQYMARLLEVRTDVENGRSLRQAIIMGYCGRLQTRLLHMVGELPATQDEKHSLWIYTPQEKSVNG
jgi:hypothetical protein